MKKDEYWNTMILWALAMAGIVAMVAGRFAESWSQNHTNDYDFFLYATLGGILAVYLIRSFAHERKDRVAFKIFGIDVRNRHINRITAYMFFGVLVFGVNSRLWWVETLHLIFTASAIVSGLAGMIYYYKRHSMEFYSSILGGALGAAGFLTGFLTNHLTVAEGEAIVAFPLAIWLLLTTKKDNDDKIFKAPQRAE